jgi:hypothetical protein
MVIPQVLKMRARLMTVRTRQLMIGKRISGALAPAWHGSQDLCFAFVAALVNELAARERHALAHLHGRLALWAQERMSV